MHEHHGVWEYVMNAEARGNKAETFRALHVPGRPLVAPNGWDAASAKIIGRWLPRRGNKQCCRIGLPRLGGRRGSPVEAMLATANAMARAVSVPVTVDFERGYRLPPEELVERLAATGAVGLNLEDSDPATGVIVEISEQVEFLRGVRGAAVAAELDLVINARTDAFLRRVGTPAEQLAASVERGNRYLDAAPTASTRWGRVIRRPSRSSCRGSMDRSMSRAAYIRR